MFPETLLKISVSGAWNLGCTLCFGVDHWVCDTGPQIWTEKWPLGPGRSSWRVWFPASQNDPGSSPPCSARWGSTAGVFLDLIYLFEREGAWVGWGWGRNTKGERERIQSRLPTKLRPRRRLHPRPLRSWAETKSLNPTDCATQAPGVVFLTTLLLHMGRSGLLYVKFLQRLSHSLHRVLLHLLQHIWDRGLSVAQGYRGAQGGRPQQSPEGGAGDAQTQREPLSLPKPWRI